MKRPALYGMMVLAFSMACEVLGAFYLTNRSPLPMALMLHLLAAASASVSVGLCSRNAGKAAPFAFVYLMILPFLGYLTVIQIMLRSGKRTDPAFFRELTEAAEAGISQDPPAHRNQSLACLRKGFEIESLTSVMKSSGAEDKLDAIRLMSAMPGSDKVTALRSLLKDPDRDVRFLAGEEIARLSELSINLIIEAEREIEKDPDNASLYCKLASLHMQNAFSGLYEGTDSDAKLLNARKAVEKSLSLDENLFSALYLAGRLYMALGDFERALSCLEKARQHKDNDVPTLLAMAECHWERKDLSGVDHCIASLEGCFESYRGEDRTALLNFIGGWREQSD